MNLVDQLVEIYYAEEWWQKDKLTHQAAYYYHDTLLNKKNRIVPFLCNDVVLGYVESWRINFEQFGRLVCHAPFNAPEEDVETGNIAYVANVWVRKQERRGEVIRFLKDEFVKQNFMCEYFCGEAIRKKTGLIKVFNRSKIGELIHGIQ